MTIAELLSLVGRAWSRLAIYPGGLAIVLALWATARAAGLRPVTRGLGRFFRGPAAPAPQPAQQDPYAPAPPSLAEHTSGLTTLALSAVAFPWLAVALLPLPYAAGLGRPVDLVVILALLEWPRLLVTAAELRGGPHESARGVRRLAAALNSYPPLVLAALVLGQSVGSLELGAVASGPADDASALSRGLFWVGATALLLVLPPLLGVGPFTAGGERLGALEGGLTAIGLRVRALGLALVAVIPWLALLPAAREDGSPAVWLAPLPPLAIGALVWWFDRLTRGRAPLPWARGYLWLSAGLLAALAVAAAEALRQRLA